MYCHQCGNDFDTKELAMGQAICPECLAHDMAHGGNWSGMTGIQETSARQGLPQNDGVTEG